MINSHYFYTRRIMAMMVAFAVSGCAEWRDGMEEALGWRKPQFNEAAILESPPLTLPPDFALRTPEDGAPPLRSNAYGGRSNVDGGNNDDPTKISTAAIEEAPPVGGGVNPRVRDAVARDVARSPALSPSPPPAPARQRVRSSPYKNAYANIPPATQDAYRRALQGGLPVRRTSPLSGQLSGSSVRSGARPSSQSGTGQGLARGTTDSLATVDDSGASQAEKVCREVIVDVRGQYVCRR